MQRVLEPPRLGTHFTVLCDNFANVAVNDIDMLDFDHASPALLPSRSDSACQPEGETPSLPAAS